MLGLKLIHVSKRGHWCSVCLKIWWLPWVRLTHCGPVVTWAVLYLGQHRFRKWVVAWIAASHYLDQWGPIINWTLRISVQLNLNQNIKKWRCTWKCCLQNVSHFVQSSVYQQIFSVHKNHRTRPTFPKARPKCLMRNFTNLNRIY